MHELWQGAEQSVPVASISRGLENWLTNEHHTSLMGRNNYLNSFVDRRRWLTLPFDDPDNYSAVKAASHINRIKFWMDAYKSLPTDDFQTARMLFATQMRISGTFRNQLSIETNNQDDYIKRFKSEPAGIDMPLLVREHLATWFTTPPTQQDFINADTSIEYLESRTVTVAQKELATLKSLYGSTQSEDQVDVKQWSLATTTMQEAWLKLAIDYIIHAAKLRGGKISAVPFLEPKSISDDPQVYYPFIS